MLDTIQTILIVASMVLDVAMLVILGKILVKLIKKK